jgi:hypothetical protein
MRRSCGLWMTGPQPKEPGQKAGVGTAATRHPETAELLGAIEAGSTG